MSLISLGTVNFDGLVTGLNTTGLIDELAQASGRSVTLMNQKVTSLESKQSLYTTLNTRLAALDSALEAIEDSDDFREMGVTVEDDASYSVTATGEAIDGSYNISVEQLAKAQIDLFELDGNSGLFSTATTGIASFDATTSGIFDNTGTVDITLNGDVTNISVDTDTTLTSLASDINDIDGITAYVVQTQDADDTGTDEFVLVIQADDTGEDGGAQRITYGQTGSFSEVVTGEAKQVAQNAEIIVGGTTLESSSNVFTSIEGMTITAEKEDAGTNYTTTLAMDTAAMAEKVSNVVDAINGIISLVKTNTKITSSGTNQDSISLGGFVGESTPRTIINRLRTILGEDYGTALGITGRTAASQIGISTNGSTGLLSFSSADFIEAYNESASDIEALFSDSTGSLSEAIREEVSVYIQPSTGIIAEIDEALDGEIEALEDSIDSEERRIEKFKARLRKQFTGLETITSSLKTTSSFLTSFFAPKSTS
jgi:flagellar hook-associated protein 2